MTRAQYRAFRRLHRELKLLLCYRRQRAMEEALYGRQHRCNGARGCCNEFGHTGNPVVDHGIWPPKHSWPPGTDTEWWREFRLPGVPMD